MRLGQTRVFEADVGVNVIIHWGVGTGNGKQDDRIVALMSMRVSVKTQGGRANKGFNESSGCCGRAAILLPSSRVSNLSMHALEGRPFGKLLASPVVIEMGALIGPD